MTADYTLHFDNPREARELAGSGGEILQQAARTFGVQMTARDLWLKIVGPPEAVERARQYFEMVRRARAHGIPMREHGLLYALQAFRQGREHLLDDLYSIRIEVAPGKAPVFPRTFGQLDYVRAMASNDIAIGIGPAGTGKTYLAMAMAVSTWLRGEVGRIILTRPAVEAGEALGFLPGDIREKVSPYLRPLYDALYDMMPAEDIERNLERGVIEIAPLAYMRGRTLNHAFVILDEGQNTTQEQMFMFLTRLGFDSKCVVTGDITQIDLPPSKQSGLVEAIRILRNVPGIAIIELGDGDVVRHELVQRIIQAYRRERSGMRAADPPSPSADRTA